MKQHIERLLLVIRPRLPLLLLAVIPVLIMEILSRGNYIEMMTWSYKHVLELLFNEWIVVSLLLLFVAIIGRTRIAYWVISGFLIILALISGVKLKILGVPLTPWDLVVAGEASDMVKYLSNILTLNVLSVILLFLVGSYFILYRTTMFIKKVALKERGILAGIGLVMFLAVYTDLPLPVQKWFGIEAADLESSSEHQNKRLCACNGIEYKSHVF